MIKTKIVSLAMLVCLGLVLMAGYSFITTVISSAYPFKVPLYQTVDPVPTRRAFAKRILLIQREIEALAGKNATIDSVWAMELLAIAADLDSRITKEFNEDLNSTFETQPSEISTNILPKKRHVCPEVYRGRSSDNSLQNNFIQLKCDFVPEFKDVITIIVSAKRWDFDRIRFIVKNIRKYYDVNIFVLTYGTNTSLTLDIDGAFIKTFAAGTSESYAINSVAASISTPFTLVTNSLTHFSRQISLERLVRVLDDLENANIASGAYRSLNGYWSHGCLQQRMENYQLVYVRGYEHSKHECMFCDDVLGPFVVRTEFLKEVPLTESLEGSVMFHDWFINVRLLGSLVVACPDVMFFIEVESIMEHDDWLKIAKKWSLQYIKPYDEKELEFSCEEAEITCINLMTAVASFLLPPCCRKKIRRELGYIEDCAEKLGVYYEFQAGTLLGAVKADGLLPWDFDTDVLTDCKDQQLWLTKGMDCMKRKNCKSVLISGSYWTSTCELSTIDISCRYNSSIYLPPEYRGVPTRANVDGKSSIVMANPGLTVRNYYGREYLKHAVHWRYSSNSLVPKDDGLGQLPGMWSLCKEPGFHSCLDHFPVDGNLKFKKLSQQLH